MPGHRLPQVLRLLIPALLAIGAGAARADEIRWSVVDNPRSMVITDRSVETRWKGLFDTSPKWAGRQIAYIVRHEPESALTLLSARLLYAGEPWTRRPEDNSSLSAREWRQRSAEVNGAILRELRWHPQRVLFEVYRRFLVREQRPDLIRSALVNLLAIDADTAAFLALRLADPGLPDALPGVVSVAVRQECTAFLVETRGLGSAEALQALGFALLSGTGGERIHAIRLVPRGEQRVLLEQAGLRLVRQHRERPLEGDDREALALIGSHLEGIADRDLALGLADLVVHGDRALATAAASALAGGVPWDLAMPVADMAGRVNGVADPALRHALLGLVMRLKPALVHDVVDADNPWSDLADHRAALAVWAFKGMVR